MQSLSLSCLYFASDPVAVALSDGKVCTGIGEKVKCSNSATFWVCVLSLYSVRYKEGNSIPVSQL